MDLCVNLLRWSLKHGQDGISAGAQSVNLLRWSLKHAIFKVIPIPKRCKFTPMEFETISARRKQLFRLQGVNLLRWSLKLALVVAALVFTYLCKFTPMEFETWRLRNSFRKKSSVNLLRWSLKLMEVYSFLPMKRRVNLLRWSLKHSLAVFVSSRSSSCKFTPMEFETGSTPLL